MVRTKMAKNRKNLNAKITMVNIEELRPSSVQPRSQFDDEKIAELAESIGQHGILQPLIVRKNQTGALEIVAGERRFRAAHKAKLKKLPCIIMNLVTDDALAVALVENIQREDLNPIEEAMAYLRLKETLKISQEDIASKIGKDRTSIANTMRLLRLPKVVQQMVAMELLSMGHARALLGLDSGDMVVMLAKKINREGLSVRRVEALIRSIKSGYQPTELTKTLNVAKDERDPLHKEIRQRLEYALGTKVTLKKESGGYAIVIHFANTEQLNGLLDSLGVEI
ncbi:MAG TPA: ParB/RepB/Spo0J family partition protein [Myxococcota bacterium]|nr:ParB/RepB/Spo0J family partition protein [Myxococcota bacterium]